MDFKRTKYDGVVFFEWADVIGWGISLSCVAPIPIYAIYTWVNNSLSGYPCLQVRLIVLGDLPASSAKGIILVQCYNNS